VPAICVIIQHESGFVTAQGIARGHRLRRAAAWHAELPETRRSGSAAGLTARSPGPPVAPLGCRDEGVGVLGGRSITRLAQLRACALSSARRARGSAGRPGRTAQGSLPGPACPALRCGARRCASRRLGHGLPEPPSSLGTSVFPRGAVPPRLLGRHGPAACRGGGTRASEPRTEGRFARKRGLASLRLTLELRRPSAALSVEPCGNALMEKGKRSPEGRRCWQPARQTREL